MAGKLSYGIEAVAKACWNNEKEVKKSPSGLCTVRIPISIKRHSTLIRGLAKVSPMLFLLRSIFWLLIVFESISWPSGPGPSVTAKAMAARGVQDILGQMIGMAQALEGRPI
jgi:hypothetical protein